MAHTQKIGIYTHLYGKASLGLEWEKEWDESIDYSKERGRDTGRLRICVTVCTVKWSWL